MLPQSDREWSQIESADRFIDDRHEIRRMGRSGRAKKKKFVELANGTETMVNASAGCRRLLRNYRFSCDRVAATCVPLKICFSFLINSKRISIKCNKFRRARRTTEIIWRAEKNAEIETNIRAVWFSFHSMRVITFIKYYEWMISSEQWRPFTTENRRQWKQPQQRKKKSEAIQVAGNWLWVSRRKNAYWILITA